MVQGLSPRALSGRGKNNGTYGVKIVDGMVQSFEPVESVPRILLIENGAEVPPETPVGTIIVEKDAP